MSKECFVPWASANTQDSVPFDIQRDRKVHARIPPESACMRVEALQQQTAADVAAGADCA